jgi:ectoine hydroxylase-related dioxygenase (phytanoyl-CoA dioxygenase family)
MKLGDAEIARYHEQGFLLVDLLGEAEAAELRRDIDRILGWDPPRVGRDTGFHASENQHFGDDIGAYGQFSKHYYFHLITDERFLPIQRVFHHPRVFAAVESILGAPLILNNASLFAAEPGTAYRLGWHRDVIQIPQEQIDEAAIYRAERFHNSVQINLPLVEDDTLWVVPGSHRRPNTEAERAAFAGSKHYAPMDARMPGAVNVRMRPGQAALYNNNLIHTGQQERFRMPRRSLHLGYHCAAKPPTWHFYLLNERMFTDGLKERMSPRVRAMIDDYFACRREHPRMEDTWTPAALSAATTR